MKSQAKLLGRLHAAREQRDDAAPPSTRAPGVDLLDKEALARIGSYELIAKSVVDGLMSGKHRSTHRGGCTEQVDHRPYAQGDETRLIDWRLFARRDRHYVKLFADETNLQAWLLLDSSASMDFGTKISKHEYASRACACLGRLLLRQRDAVGLLVNRGNRIKATPPRSQPAHFQEICQRLATHRPKGTTTAASLLSAVPTMAKRRGIVVLFSDCFGDLDELLSALKNVRVRGHDVIVLQVLAPEEIDFSFRRAAIFEGLEGSVRMRVDPSRVRARYLERFQKHQTELREELARVDCDLHTLTTEEDLGGTLSRFLGFRAARSGAPGRAR